MLKLKSAIFQLKFFGLDTETYDKKIICTELTNEKRQEKIYLFSLFSKVNDLLKLSIS